jgi:cysteinyl-tRNA synthetase
LPLIHSFSGFRATSKSLIIAPMPTPLNTRPALRFFNTLTRKVEEFKPITADHVGLYACGPTVYNYAHIGNLRTYLFEDLLRRTLERAGYTVTHVCNITDVGHLTSDGDLGDDKMEAGAKREGKSVWDIAKFYTEAFWDDLKKLNITPATHWPRATDHIPEQIDMIRTLVDKGFGYVADDGIYYDISRFPSYGDFARKDMKGQEAGARVACAGGKRNNEDFALWKFSPKDSQRLMEWDSPWGKGFPGWHIECSAMSVKYLGEQFDLHCGGIDHIPVHHTNEIAQTEAVTGKRPWVSTWLHGEFLIMDKAKMSKSSGEFLTLARLIERGYDPLDYRFFCLQAHYRQGLTFTFEALDAAKAGRHGLMQRLDELVGINEPAAHPSTELRVERLPQWIKFWEALADDLNAPRAMAVLFDSSRDASLSKAQRAGLMAMMDSCLGLRLLAPRLAKTQPRLDPEEQGLLDERAAARKAKDYSKADALRDQLAKLGITVKDSPQGQEWSRS